jgi:tRNA modification GTPase
MMSLNDTIVACATAAGYSSIAVLRVSGPETKQYINKIFQSKNTDAELMPNRAYYGMIVNPQTGDLID